MVGLKTALLVSENNMNNLKKRSWEELKALVASGAGDMDYDTAKKRYKVFVVSGDTTFFTNLYEPGSRMPKNAPMTNDVDYQDFETNFKTNIDTNPPATKRVVELAGVNNDGGKLQINPSSRPIIKGVPLNTVFVGAGDDIVNHKLGYGPQMMIETVPGQPNSYVDIHFDTSFGKVFLQEGYAMWADAGFGDHISIAIFASATKLQTTSNLNMVLEAAGSTNKLKYVGDGNGTHGFGGLPVLVPANEGPSIWGDKKGWWDYSVDTGLTPNTDQMGAYDIYNTDVEVGRFVNAIPVYGTTNQYMNVKSSDYAEIPPHYFLRFLAGNVSNTTWKTFIFLTMFRETSVDGNTMI
jgi:hypothetical protein